MIKEILKILCLASAIAIFIINPIFWIYVACNGFDIKKSIKNMFYDEEVKNV